MERTWLPREVANLKQAHEKKVCCFNPKWGRCSHDYCKAIWNLTPDKAQPEERQAIFGVL